MRLPQAPFLEGITDKTDRDSWCPNNVQPKLLQLWLLLLQKKGKEWAVASPPADTEAACVTITEEKCRSYPITPNSACKPASPGPSHSCLFYESESSSIAFNFIFREAPTAYGSSQELQLPAYTTATATWDPSRVYDLPHSSRPRWILNPLSEARDRTCVLMVPHWIHFP